MNTTLHTPTTVDTAMPFGEKLRILYKLCNPREFYPSEYSYSTPPFEWFTNTTLMTVYSADTDRILCYGVTIDEAIAAILHHKELRNGSNTK